MAAPLKNIWCKDRRNPFQVNQLPGKDFQSLSAKNYNYAELWIFPHDLCVLLGQEKTFNITRLFRYSNPDQFLLATLPKIDPKSSTNDRDIIYMAKIAEASEKFLSTLAGKTFKHSSTHIQLDPLKITLQVGTETATLILEEKHPD